MNFKRIFIIPTLALVFASYEMIQPVDNFVAVSNISSIADSALTTADLPLIATVSPENVTNKTIVWSVKNAGRTGAVIINNEKLRSSHAGTVTLSATITDGRSKGTHYSKDFEITVTQGLQLVNKHNLTELVPRPIAGTSPGSLTNEIHTEQYDGSITWSRQDGLGFSSFELYISYQATITLTPRSGFTFDGVSANSFTYEGATSVTYAANSGTVTIVFQALAPQTVTALDLTSLVTAPVRGDRADTATISTGQYTGSVNWRTSSNSSFSSYFDAGAVYKAVVTLSAVTGYTFNGVTANSFTYAGATSVTNVANSGTVTIVFPATVDPVVVTAFDLSSFLTAPVKGASPNTASISTEQYTGSITWRTSSDSSVGSYFAANTVYKAIVTLTPRIGYTFNGVSSDAFSYTGATSVTNSANSRTVTIVFPVTEPLTIVSTLDLSSLVTVPVKGASPNTASISTEQYTGSITWRTSSDSSVGSYFAVNTVYKAVVTLTPRSGYTFDGISANAFTYSGATSVTNTANSNKVTIVFPATAKDAITEFNLTSYITRPTIGQAPSSALSQSSSQFTGSISWLDENDLAVASNFIADTTYKAVVTLVPTENYTFDAVTANCFSYTNAITLSNSAGSSIITITFPKIVSANLTGLITAPVVGETPVTTAIDTTQFSGTVSWKENNGSLSRTYFRGSKTYKAELSLSAKNGYTFSGTPSNYFTFPDATTTNSANSSLVSLSFQTDAITAFLYVNGNTTPQYLGLGVNSTVNNIVPWIKNNASSSSSYLIKIIDSEDVQAKNLDNLNNANNVSITITGLGEGNSEAAWPVIQISGRGSLFTVGTASGNNVSVIMDGKMVLKGVSSNNASLIKVNATGQLELGDSVKVTDNLIDTGSALYGSGIYVDGGSLTMNDNAVVSENGASHWSSSTSSYGGGVYVANGAFSMYNNAVVSGNTASASHSGSAYGGGVYIAGGTFSMNNDAVVSGNRASASGSGSAYGGGVYIAGGAFSMNDNAVVSGNVASDYGGGVYLAGGTFNMNDMAIISGNTSDYGGGVSIKTGVTAAFNKIGGVIYGSSVSGNDASGTPLRNSSTPGASIYLDSSHYKNNHITEDMDMSYDYNGGSRVFTGLWTD